MDLSALLAKFAAAVEAHDGDALADCFTEDGVYDDYFYGAFAGRQAIADMLERLWYRDGEDFRWEMIDPVSDGETGYARWLFSYTSRMPQNKGARAFAEGVGCFKLRDGLILRYEDMVKSGESLFRLGLPPEKLHRVLAKWTERQLARPDVQAHLKR